MIDLIFILRFTGVYIILLILLENIDCGYSLELPHNLCFAQEYEKFQIFFSDIFPFIGCKLFNIFE